MMMMNPLLRSLLVSFWLPAVSSIRILPHHFTQTNHAKDDGRRRTTEVPIPTNPDDHLVKNLPYFDGTVAATQWAGLLPASPRGDKYLFYWLFAPDTTAYSGKPEDIPLLLWLNGGPGCSSMDGLFLEHGPLQLVADGGAWKVTERTHSWHKAPAYVIYLDQPVGTGLSFTTSNTYPSNDPEVNADFYYWLQQFLTLHGDKFLNPERNKLTRKFFFSGESHAGTSIFVF
jgi:carboxypeptidase D